MRVNLIFLFFLCFLSCQSQQPVKDVLPGAYQTEEYLPLLKDKSVGLLVNQTSYIDNTHLVDSLLHKNIKITRIFAPEHGFRGKHDAGETVNNEKDEKTGVPIVSLYGKNKKPTSDQLKDIDVVVFDIQDVGVRFYTYISTMHYMMEACAENGVKLIVLDRPNPNGDYFDGPILKPENKSFVGLDPIPVVHGLTVGELAMMINGEGWLKNGVKCDLTVIKLKHWNHNTVYKLPIKPSPNLPNYISVRLYPSLCFFEATNVSIGRGTYFPFQVIGFPDSTAGNFTFTPVSIDGMSKHPKQQDKLCYGIDLRDVKDLPRFTLSYFIDFYNKYGKDEGFGLSKSWFNLLAGDSQLIKDIQNGKPEKEIKESWMTELKKYSDLRDKYLLYPKEK